MKKFLASLTLFSAVGIFATDVQNLLNQAEYRDNEIFLTRDKIRSNRQFEYNLYHANARPTTKPDHTIVFDLLTFTGGGARKFDVRYSRNKMTLGTDRAISVMEKLRFKSPVEKGDWRQYAELAQRQIRYAMEDLKHLHISTFQRLGEAIDPQEFYQQLTVCPLTY